MRWLRKTCQVFSAREKRKRWPSFGAWRTTEPIRQAKRADKKYVNLLYEDMQKQPREFFESIEAFFELERSRDWATQSAEQVISPKTLTVSAKTIHSNYKLGSIQAAIGRIISKRSANDGDPLNHLLTIPEVAKARSLMGYTRWYKNVSGFL